MTATTGNTRTRNLAGPGPTGHVLLRDDLGRLRLRRLRPWHWLLARCAAAGLERGRPPGAPPDARPLFARAGGEAEVEDPPPGWAPRPAGDPRGRGAAPGRPALA